MSKPKSDGLLRRGFLRSSLGALTVAAGPMVASIGCGGGDGAEPSTEHGSNGIGGTADGTGFGGASTGGINTPSGGATMSTGGTSPASGGGPVSAGGTSPASGGASVAGTGGATTGGTGTGGVTVGTGGVGTGGIDVGTGGIDVGTGGIDVGTGGIDVGTGGGIVGTGGSIAGTGGSDSGVGGSDSGVGGSDSGAGGSTAGAGGSGGAGTGGEVIQVRQIETRGFTFDARETAADGEPVLLLHGFPDTSLMWSRLMPVLAENGYHCLAPDQRGYSPGARPTEVDAYVYAELIADAFAFGDELGERFHLVAHDWGANIGWLMLATDPSRIASFTAISIPHYGVWAASVYDDPEMAGYLSMLNVWMTPGDGEDFWTADAMRNMWTAKPADETEATIAHMMEPGAMTAALNWYRASDGHQRVIEDFGLWEVNVPTLLIHGSTDLGERSVTDTAPLMTGSYRVARPAGGHFIVDEQPQDVADETLAHLQANSIQ